MPTHASASVSKTKLTSRQQELLASVTVADNRAVFGGEQIPDWKALKSVLEALGGKWKTGKPGGFIFPEDIDAAEAVRLAKDTGEIIDPNAHDFYPTPDGLADRVVSLAEIGNGMTVLEPSAGKGALVSAVRRYARATRIVCFEVLPANVRSLRDFGANVEVNDADFLQASPGKETFDRVVMNPPFSKRMDIHHVNHAFGFLKPGGKLVAIMSSGVAHRSDKLASTFRALVASNGGRIEENPAGSFRESGTMVNTVTVVLPKGA